MTKQYWSAIYPLPTTVMPVAKWQKSFSEQLNAVAKEGWRIVSTAKTGSEQFAAALVVIWERDT